MSKLIQDSLVLRGIGWSQMDTASKEIATNIVRNIPCDLDMGAVFICAIRYCLGRRTYMPSLVTGVIWQYVGNLDDRDIDVILRDIRQQRDLGDDCDRKIWMDFIGRLGGQKERRCKDAFCG